MDMVLLISPAGKCNGLSAIPTNEATDLGSIMTPEQVKPYIWPHFDFGKMQVRALLCDSFDLNHGDTILFPLGKKATFRILEANLYTEEWMKEALPIAKALWEIERNRKAGTI